MKFFITPKSISVLVLNLPILIYITNGGVVNIIIIIRKSFLKSFTI